ncbi:MAG: YwiC-like family protein [Melioribacteraceae bacterium]|nr:YwiC-like family protein [Melioribacteraceae bacterium]
MILSKIALPKEHGAWGFVLEPLLLSLIVAFTLDGLLLALATFFMFLLNQPFKILTTKSVNKKFRTTAIALLIFYLSIAILLLVFPLLNTEFYLLLPFYTAVIILLVYKYFEFYNFSRNLFIELLPIFSMTLIATSIVMIDNSFTINPIVFGILLLSRAVPTVIYINAKVKWIKGFEFSIIPTHILNSAFFLFIIYASFNNLLPMLSILGAFILTLRSAIGFSRFNFCKTVKQIGVAEFIYGSLFVVINGIAFLI